MKEKYDFSFIKWKIKFSSEKINENKKFKKSIFESIFNARIRELLSMPFIYSMIIPAVIFDIFLFMYQQTAIRLYWIPIAKRSDYIVFDRKHLDYLNLIQKVNCLYCSYVNGLLSYWVEIAWRTEKYWCPIKSASRLKWWHDWEEYFADYWDPVWFKEEFTNTECFKKDKK
jgi:hypothetical protein